jgi:hypothetical protein
MDEQKQKGESDMDTGDEGDQEDFEEETRKLLDMADSPTKSGAASGTGSTPLATTGIPQAPGSGTDPDAGPGSSTENRTGRRRNSFCTTDDIRNLNKLEIKKVPQLAVYNAVSLEYLPATSAPDACTGGVTGTGTGNLSPGLDKIPGVPTGKKNIGTRTLSYSGSGETKNSNRTFPNEYYSIRKARAGMRKQKELPAVTGNVRTANLPRGLALGFENSDDDRHLSVRNFHIPELSKNNSESIADDGGKLACVSCPVKHVFDGLNLVCLILMDQNFPPSLS